MTDTKPKSSYAWVIFVCSCLLAASAMALTVSILGVFLLPESQKLGVNPGDFAMWATLSGFVSTIMLAVYGQLLAKYTKLCFTIGAAALIITELTFAFAPNAMVTTIVCGITVGLEMPVLFTSGLPSIMGQWFVGKQRGKFLGIATAFSGVGTFVWAPMFTAIIQSLGVQTAYIIAAIIAAVCTIPMAVLAVWDPASKGQVPVGWTEQGEEEETPAVDNAIGVTAARAMKSPAFWIFIIAVILVAVGAGFNNNQPALCAETIGGEGAAMLGASMISAGAVGNILGKIVFGIVSDKIGPKLTNIIFLCFSLIAMLLWVFAVGEVTYIIAGFLFGTNNAVASVGFPLTCRAVFGNKDYAKIWSRLCMGSALLGGFGTSFVQYLSQGTGSLVNAIWVGFVMFIVAIICATIAISFAGKIKESKE